MVDWHLLVFFAALFVVVDGLSDTGLPDAVYRHVQPIFGAHVTAQTWNLTWFSVGARTFSRTFHLFLWRGNGSRTLPSRC